MQLLLFMLTLSDHTRLVVLRFCHYIILYKQRQHRAGMRVQKTRGPSAVMENEQKTHSVSNLPERWINANDFFLSFVQSGDCDVLTRAGGLSSSIGGLAKQPHPASVLPAVCAWRRPGGPVYLLSASSL